MRLINKIGERGFIELILLTFLAIILIQLNSLWTLSKLKLNQEKISIEVLNEDYDKKLKLHNLLTSDPELNSVGVLSRGFKSNLKSPFSNTTFQLPDKSPSLNWLFYNSLNIDELSCSPAPNSLCNLNTYSLSTSKISPFTETYIKVLNIIPNQNHLAIISLGNLTIESLGLNQNALPPTKYVLIFSYNNLKIDRISGTTLNGIKLLFYSILGEVAISDIGTNKPCDPSGTGNLVFISPSVQILGKKRADLKVPSKSCLKDFPNKIFTSIKIASIH